MENSDFLGCGHMAGTAGEKQNQSEVTPTNRHTCKLTPSPSSSAYIHHLYVALATEPTQVQRSDYKRLNEVKTARAALEARSLLSLTLRGE
jgi:hypothetical protein